jgi:putative peptidoglycan lipid II flippase
MTKAPEAHSQPSGVSGRVALNAVLVAALFALDKLLGVVREVVVGRAFGLSPELDAYFAAFEVPEGLNAVVTGAALTTSLIPLLAGIIVRGDEAARRNLWSLISCIVNWVLIVVGAASLVAAVFARPIILTVAPGFAASSTQVGLAVQLMRLVLIQTLVFSASTVVTSTLEAHQHFLLPALSPLFYTLGRVLGAVVLAPRFGIFGLAYGGLVGAVAHLLVKVPWLIVRRARWMPVLSHPDLLKLLKLMGPRMLGMGVTYVSFVLPTFFGSRLLPGSIAAYEYGWKLMQLPETVLGTALGIVVFPTLARLAEAGDRESLRRTFSWALRLILTFSIPSAVGLLLLGRPLIVLILEHGVFDAAATDRVFWALQFFALGLMTHSALEVVARLFYARRDMWTPLWAALAGLAVNAGLGWLLLPTLAHGAIALSNGLGAGVQVVILMIVAWRQTGGVEGRRLSISLVQVGLASAVMAAAVIAFTTWLAVVEPQVMQIALQIAEATGVYRLLDYAILFVNGVGGLAVGGVVYVLAALLFGSRELRELPALLLARKRAG